MRNIMPDPATESALGEASAAMAGCALRPVALALVSIMLGVFGVMTQAVATEVRKHLHFAVNSRGDYAGAASVGFNLADVSTQSALNALPIAMKGVYWLGNGYNTTCTWRLSDRQIIETVKAIKDHPKFSGIYYICDEPHPALCPDASQRVSERTTLIHSLDPRGKTFILVLNASAAPTEFAQMKDSADYIGVDPYPCNLKNERTGCNYTALRKRIDQALAAGIPTTRIVPVFQTFGQACTNSDEKYYRLPTAAETETMLRVWDERVPVEHRPFDMVYSWGEQPTLACPTLQTANGIFYPDLRSVYTNYFGRMDGSFHRR